MVLATFGDGICERYLLSYNKKVWNIPVEELSMLWADRIPNPNPEDILKSAIGYERKVISTSSITTIRGGRL